VGAPGAARSAELSAARTARLLGELIQIDGSDMRGSRTPAVRAATLLVYVDDATSRVMELCFAESESTFDYFRATRRYLERHGEADGLLTAIG